MTKPKQPDDKARLKLCGLQEFVTLRAIARKCGIDPSRLRAFYRGEIESLTPIEHERVMGL